MTKAWMDDGRKNGATREFWRDFQSARLYGTGRVSRWQARRAQFVLIALRSRLCKLTTICRLGKHTGLFHRRTAARRHTTVCHTFQHQSITTLLLLHNNNMADDNPEKEEAVVDDEEEDEEDLEKLQAEIERMEAEAARISKETEELEKKKESIKSSSSGDAAPAASEDSKPTNDACSIYVGQVDYSTTPEELVSHFGACGTIERVTIVCDKYTGRPKGKHGYRVVEFAIELLLSAHCSHFSLFLASPKQGFAYLEFQVNVSTILY